MSDNFRYTFRTAWSVTWYRWRKNTAEVSRVFGEPGIRYIIDADEHSTTYMFKSMLDALLFKIKFYKDIK